MPRQPYPSSRDAYVRLGVTHMVCLGSLFVFGAAFSYADVTPPWVAWLITFALVVVITVQGWRSFLRWGGIVQRRIIADSAVGSWALSRSDVEVDGMLVPYDPDDVRLFAYRVRIELSDATGHATVFPMDPIDADENPLEAG